MNTKILQDKLYFKYDKDKKTVASAADQTIIYEKLSDESNCYLPVWMRQYMLDKFLCMNEMYAYLFNLGYLTNKEYIIDSTLDEENGVYEFILSLEDLKQEANIYKILTKKFPGRNYRSYIIMCFDYQYLMAYSSVCRCCGGNINNSVSYPFQSDPEGHKNSICPDCRLLNYEKRSLVLSKRHSYTASDLIKYRNKLKTTNL